MTKAKMLKISIKNYKILIILDFNNANMPKNCFILLFILKYNLIVLKRDGAIGGKGCSSTFISKGKLHWWRPAIL